MEFLGSYHLKTIKQNVSLPFEEKDMLRQCQRIREMFWALLRRTGQFGVRKAQTLGKIKLCRESAFLNLVNLWAKYSVYNKPM